MTAPSTGPGGALPSPAARGPILTAPVLSGVPPAGKDIADLLHARGSTGGASAGGSGPRTDAPITLGGRLDATASLPDSTRLALALEAATRALQGGRPAQVLAELDRIWSPELTSDSPWYLRTSALELLGRTSDAEQVIRLAITRLPRSASLLYLLGVHTASLGHIDAARIASDHALSLHPSEPLLWIQRAALAQRAGNGAMVEQILRRIAEIDSRFPSDQWLESLARLGNVASGRPTPRTSHSVARLTPGSLPALSDDRVAASLTPNVPAGGAPLELALRLGLTLLPSPTQSARDGTRITTSDDPAVTYSRQPTPRVAVPIAPPITRNTSSSGPVVVFAITLACGVALPALRLPAVLIGAGLLIYLASRQSR
jgi:hypothetical protein